MAYMSQERKAELAPSIKALCKKYGVKATVAVRHHSTLVVTIQSGAIDFIGNFNQRASERPCPEYFQQAKNNLDVNHYWFREHFTGNALAFLAEVIEAMNVGNHDRSDSQTDYFDIGWYINVYIGRWNKPYLFIDPTAQV